MKTIFAYFTIVFLLFTGSNAFSQGYVFRVLANKGTNQVKRAAGQTEGLKTGATLKAGDQLIASKGAYIGLMHKTGKTLEVREEGVQKVNELEKKVAAKKTSVTGRYAQYVMNQINDEGVSSNYRRNNYVTGSVERGQTNAINFLLPVSDNKQAAYDPEIILRWLPAENAGLDNATYIVTVKNIFEEEVLKAETTTTSMEIDMSKGNFDENGGLYVFTVEAKGEEANKDFVFNTKEYAIELKPYSEIPEIEAELKQVMSEVDVDSGLGRIVLASFYEEKGLLLEASKQYEMAIKANPDVDDFKELYQEFLAKNKMVAPIKKGE